MRHHCRTFSNMKPVHGPRTTPAWLSLLGGVSALAMALAAPAHAQQAEFVVDVSDPSISIDLSVLDDGGLTPQMGTQMPSGQVPSSARSGHQAPGPQAPVSTLYIQPSGTFSLPPQTKVLIAEPTPEVIPEAEPADVAEAPAPVTQAPVPPAPVTAEPESATETTPVAPAPEVAEPVVAEPVAPQAPAPVVDTVETEPTPEPDVPAAQDVAKAEPEPVAAAEPAPEPASVPTPEPAPVSEPVQAEPAPEQTPPPPPQALTQVTPQVEPEVAEPVTAPQAAPQAAPGSAQVALPPKLEETQPGVASLPSPTGPLADGDSMRIVFEHDSSKLPSTARDALKALSDRMGQQESLRLQLLAYAGDTDTSASAARRLSLSRALAVRSYLIENGVRSTRIDVRALGNKSTEEVTERVDITVVER